MLTSPVDFLLMIECDRNRRVVGRTGLWLMVLALSGCQHVDYFAHRLPVEFRASGGRSPQKVDLSRLAQQTYQTDRIYSGDVLDLTVAAGIEELPSAPAPVRVSRQGTVNVPLVGEVSIAGLTLPEAESEIYRQCILQGIYRDPQVSLIIKHRHVVTVRVIGEVQSPGVYELPVAGSDLLAALVAAGGLTENAGLLVDLRHPAYGPAIDRLADIPSSLDSTAEQTGVRLAGEADESFVDDLAGDVRPAARISESPELIRVNLRETGGDDAPDLRVRDGSVIVVHAKAPRKIHVLGLVRKPDAYEIPEDSTLRVLDAIALAGGTTLSVADKVHVIRRVEGREQPIVVRTSLRLAKWDGASNLVLQGGDVVSVEETATTFVIDTLRSFIRFGFSSTVPGL